MRRFYVATVQILIEAKNEADACDGFTEILSHNQDIIDWGYLNIGGQMLYPSERYLTIENYKEGDFLRGV